MAQRVYRERQLTTGKGHTGLLPISPATLWRWVKLKTFPQPFKLGERVTVWDAAEVDAFLKAQREASTAGATAERDAAKQEPTHA